MNGTPPHSIEAEQRLLGQLIRLGSVPQDLVLSPAAFYQQKHQDIYRAICVVADESDLDLVAICEEMKRTGSLDRAGGPAYVAALPDAVATTANIKHHQQIIREKAALRYVQDWCRKTSEFIANPTARAAEIIEDGKRFFQTVDQRFMQGREDEEKNLTQAVREWAMTTKDNFKTTDANNFFKMTTQDNMKKMSVILNRLASEGTLEKIGRGQYRVIDKDEDIVDIINAPDEEDYNLSFPFCLEERFILGPRGVVIVAGVSNAGKTGFMMDLAYRNAETMPTFYFSASKEAHPSRLKKRARAFGPLERWASVTFIQKKGGQFQDVIRPNGLNIIDYLEIYDDFYLVNKQIASIAERLDQGVAVIGLQKFEKNKFAKGGESTREKADVYINLDLGDPCELSFVKIKSCKCSNAYDKIRFRPDVHGVLHQANVSCGGGWRDAANE